MPTIFVAGDVMNYTNTSGRICAPSVAQLVAGADYAVCNFEAPIQGFGSAQPKSGPHHAQRAETLAGLKEQGFNLILLANNHIMDYGEDGLEATLDAAHLENLVTLGAGMDEHAAYAPMKIELEGLVIGFINACEAQFGVIDYFSRRSKAGYAWINHHAVDQIVLRLRKECDFVLVFAHAGLEHYPIPQKEWRHRYRHLCDLGADAVVGSHPHVPQGYERYGSSVVFYSLGNFYFDSPKYIDKDDHSYSLLLELSQEHGVQFEPIFHYKQSGSVRIAPKDHQVDLDHLNRLLLDGYETHHDRMSLEAYKRIRTLLKTGLNPFPLNPDPLLAMKRALSTMLRRQQPVDRERLLLHLARNEAYHYATRHALEILSNSRGEEA